MDKNHIEGRRGAPSWHNTAKASGMPTEVNVAAVRQSNVPLPGEASSSKDGEESAEAIVAGKTELECKIAQQSCQRPDSAKGRTNEEGLDLMTDRSTDHAGRRGRSESCHEEKNGVPRERNLIVQILSSENLTTAWQRVRSNKGAAGVDKMSVRDFPEFCRKHWKRILADLKNGTYRPAPVRRVMIPKPDGSLRPLGVPTVLDRLIQQAIAQVIGPLFEADFSTHSYGFRPMRSAHQAVATLESGWKEGRRYAAECDLKSFFDIVNHDLLMQALREKISCRETLSLIRNYLVAGARLPDGTLEATPKGVPQGGPLSPLLANIVLDPLDKELEARGHTFARYADDFIILVKSAKAAQRVLGSVTRFCEERLKLVVNRAKSRSAPLKTCSFLGYQIGHGGKLKWTTKALQRFKQRIREITRRNRGHKVQDVIDELRLYVRGWLNYYKLSCTYTQVKELSEWLRRRVRLYYWKQWKQPRTRRRHLLALGTFPEKVHLATRSRKGYWRMSQNSIVRAALNNRWLEEQGVPNMRTIWIALHYPEQRSV